MLPVVINTNEDFIDGNKILKCMYTTLGKL